MGIDNIEVLHMIDDENAGQDESSPSAGEPQKDESASPPQPADIPAAPTTFHREDSDYAPDSDEDGDEADPMIEGLKEDNPKQDQVDERPEEVE